MKLGLIFLALAHGSHQALTPPKAQEPDHVESRTDSAARRLLYVPGSEYDRNLVQGCLTALANPSQVNPEFIQACIQRWQYPLPVLAAPSSEVSSKGMSASSEEYYVNTPVSTASEAVQETHRVSFAVDLNPFDKKNKGTLEVKYT